MGLYDNVYVSCPECGSLIEFQSKAGECTLSSFSASAVPPVIAQDIQTDIECCSNCEIRVRLIPDQPLTTINMIPVKV